eukprot:m.453259 g.453259  ORF g.453259 m.453259 type:complete len:817 (+) comp20467_c0_seq1:229-2679(+)
MLAGAALRVGGRAIVRVALSRTAVLTQVSAQPNHWLHLVRRTQPVPAVPPTQCILSAARAFLQRAPRRFASSGDKGGGGQWSARPRKRVKADDSSAGPRSERGSRSEGKGTTFRRATGRHPNDKGGAGGQGAGPPPQQGFGWELLIPPALLLAMNMFGQGDNRQSAKTLTAQFFFNELLARGEVKRVDITSEEATVLVYLEEGAVIPALGDYADRHHYVVTIGSVDAFVRQLESVQTDMGLEERDFVPIRYIDTNSQVMRDVAMSVLPIVFIASVYFVLSRRMRALQAAKGGPPGGKGDSNNPLGGFGRMSNLTAASAEQSTTKFSDVAGLSEAKVEIKEFVDFLQNPGRFEELGAKPPTGALLVGPPGTGKTLLAKAVAGETNVPFYSVSGSDFVEMFVGVGASRVRDLFATARKTKPCIVYIDEIDAIGKKRQSSAQSGGGQERESTLNQLLVEMDGFGTEPGVVMLASTNRADTLDAALLRPGRFDRQISCDLPTLDERIDLFNLHLQPLKLAIDQERVVRQMAALSPGMSGAQIANVCNEAALIAARRGAAAVEVEDFYAASDRVIAGPEKKSRVMQDSERAIVAYHESGHVLTAWFLEHVDPLLKTTIVPRTSGALGFAQYIPSDRHLHSVEELKERLVVMLGGRAAEHVTFGRITTGASDDIRRCTDIAYAMLTQYGMSRSIGTLSWPDFPRAESGYRSSSNALAERVEAEAQQLVREAYDQAIALLSEHKAKLIVLSEELLAKETLQYDDVVRLIGPRPFPTKHPFEGALDDDGGSSETATEDSHDPHASSVELGPTPTPAPAACKPHP